MLVVPVLYMRDPLTPGSNRIGECSVAADVISGCPTFSYRLASGTPSETSDAADLEVETYVTGAKPRLLPTVLPRDLYPATIRYIYCDFSLWCCH